MKYLFLFLFSVVLVEAQASSCCVANTSLPNLMILPSSWQQTFTLASNRVIGDVSPEGRSVFRNKRNKESINLARMDLAYSWTEQYQSGVSFRYENKSRSFNGTHADDSGWSDVNLFHAYQPVKHQRTWIFNSINIPTSKSLYESDQTLLVDSHGTGTYQAGVGLFHLLNFKTWDFIFSSEVHHSFSRTFKQSGIEKKIGSFWGTSLSLGAGYIPWRSKFRYGLNITPRYEGAKKIQNSSQSMVWDSLANVTYTYNEKYALGVNYLDQTWIGPAKNTLLNRSVSFVFQTHYL